MNFDNSYEILSPGDKIKKIRKYLKVSQQELCNNIISKPMLSYIENNKLNLTLDVAKKLCERFHYLDSYLNISVEELFLTKEMQANRIIINFIKTPSIQDIDTAIFIKCEAEKYASREYIYKFNFIVSAHLYNKYSQFETSIEFLEPYIIEIFQSNNELLTCATLILSSCYNRMGYYNKNIIIYDGMVLQKIKNNEAKGYILYNLAFSFHKSKNCIEAINIYQSALSFLKNQNMRNNCIINIGDCFSLYKEFAKAIEYFNFQIKKTNSNHLKVICYSKIIINAIETENYCLVKETIPLLENSLLDITIQDKYQNYMSLGMGYLFLGDRFNAMINFEKEINLRIDSSNFCFSIENYLHAVLELLKIYNRNDENKITSLCKKIAIIPIKLLNKKDIITLLNTLLKYHYPKYSEDISNHFLKNMEF